jgi:hypothetical protein
MNTGTPIRETLAITCADRLPGAGRPVIRPWRLASLQEAKLGVATLRNGQRIGHGGLRDGEPV